MKLGKPIPDGTRAGISRRKAAKTRCCPRLVKEPPSNIRCTWTASATGVCGECGSLSAAASPDRDGCPPSKGSRRKDMSALPLLLSGGRNSQEFSEISTGCNALFTLFPKPWIPRHHLAGDGNIPHIPRLLKEINRVKVLRHPR